jgi:alpha-glucosidase
MKFISVLSLLVCSISLKAADKIIHISSPDKNIAVTVTAGNTITYQVSYKGSAITSQNRISMRLGNGEILGVHSRMIRSSQELVNKKVYPVYGMANEYSDNYSRLELVFDKKFSIVFRVYNNGVAYRFSTSMAGKIQVEDEEVSYSFTDDVKASMMKVNNFVNSYEEHYIDIHPGWTPESLCHRSWWKAGIKIGITEADLLDYAGMYLTYDSVNTLSGIFPKFVLMIPSADIAPL